MSPRCDTAFARHGQRGVLDHVFLPANHAAAAELQENLARPLAEIAEGARSLGRVVPEIRVALRSGDSTASERAALVKHPPEILVTTPESLYLLLTSPRGREMLRTVRTVIVDEIHALAGNKRGAHLALSLERLAALCPERLVPGRGDALESPDACQRAIAMTREFVTTLLAEVRRGREAGQSLKAIYDATYAVMKPRYGDWVIFEHCMPFDVVRAYDEASGIQHPRIWTAERDREMWAALAG